MKIKIIIITLLFTFVLAGFSQQQTGSLEISLEQAANNKDPKQLKIVVNVASSLSEGMFISLPPQIKPAIRSIKLDGNELWLINSAANVEKENVVGWYTQDDGIVLHYNDTLNGEFTIQIVFDIIEFNKAEDTQVAIYGIDRVDQEIIIESTVFAQSDISNIKNSQPDEN